MNIRPTQFTREDGVSIFQLPTGLWAIRKIDGHTWFYNIETKTWVWGPSVDLDDMSYSESVAMETLKTVKKDGLT